MSRFDYKFTDRAERIPIPAGTTGIVITGTLSLPVTRPEGGIISLLGIRVGEKEGKRELAAGWTIGLKDQWRLEARLEKQAGGRAGEVPWGADVDFEMKWGSGASSVRTLGHGSVSLATGPGTAPTGGVLFIGMDWPKKEKKEYVPLIGGRIEGEIQFLGGAVEPPPPGDSEDNFPALLQAFEEDFERLSASWAKLLEVLRGS